MSDQGGLLATQSLYFMSFYPSNEFLVFTMSRDFTNPNLPSEQKGRSSQVSSLLFVILGFPWSFKLFPDIEFVFLAVGITGVRRYRRHVWPSSCWSPDRCLIYPFCTFSLSLNFLLLFSKVVLIFCVPVGFPQVGTSEAN